MEVVGEEKDSLLSSLARLICGSFSVLEKSVFFYSAGIDPAAARAHRPSISVVLGRSRSSTRPHKHHHHRHHHHHHLSELMRASTKSDNHHLFLNPFSAQNTENPFSSTHSLDTNPFDDPTPDPAHVARMEELAQRERDLERRETELAQKADHIKRHGRNNFPPCKSRLPQPIQVCI